MRPLLNHVRKLGTPLKIVFVVPYHGRGRGRCVLWTIVETDRRVGMSTGTVSTHGGLTTSSVCPI